MCNISEIRQQKIVREVLTDPVHTLLKCIQVCLSPSPGMIYSVHCPPLPRSILTSSTISQLANYQFYHICSNCCPSRIGQAAEQNIQIETTNQQSTGPLHDSRVPVPLPAFEQNDSATHSFVPNSTLWSLCAISTASSSVSRTCKAPFLLIKLKGRLVYLQHVGTGGSKAVNGDCSHFMI